MSFLTPHKPWIMCSSIEASDRVAFKELSQFECTSSTYNCSHPRDRKPDPFKCVKKYRRSAAGGGVQSQSLENGNLGERSLEDLEITVDYLLGQIFAQQRSDGMEEQLPLVKSMNFVDDRLRAVQVDLTTLLGKLSAANAIDMSVWTTVRRMQVKLIRYNILAQYMLSSLASDKYQWKFAQKALTTAISSYFATFHGRHEQQYLSDTDEKDLDEIMCYAALLHIVTVVKKNEVALPQSSSTGQQCGMALDWGQGISAILGIYQKYVSPSTRTHNDRPDEKMYPKYQWALRIANAIDCGDFLFALRLLKPTREIQSKNDCAISRNECWSMISRCCVAQIVPILRIGLIRRYNKSFGKQEKVKDTDLANLLCLPSNEAAIHFCQAVGLPTASSVGVDGNKHDRVIMKAAPISITGKNIVKMTNPCRSEDWFVFGPRGWLTASTPVSVPAPAPTSNRSVNPANASREKKNIGMTSLQRAMMKMKVDNDPNEIDLDNDDDDSGDESLNIDSNSEDVYSRMDEDGILILPTKVICNLIG